MTVAEAAARASAYLLQSRGASGAWGYRPGQAPSGEPTLLAVLAGQPAPLVWLSEADLSWSRLLLPLALGGRPDAAPLVEEALRHILGHQGTGGETAGSFDGDLPGWPWVENTLSWVEPTAWAVRSLVAAGRTDHPRVQGGRALLADRQCSDGGWNAGNPDILGQDLPGYLYLTGLVLTALPPGHPSTEPALAFLAGVEAHPSDLNLSWAILGRTAHQTDSGALRRQLAARQQADGSFSGRVDRTAVALQALQTSS